MVFATEFTKTIQIHKRARVCVKLRERDLTRDPAISPYSLIDHSVTQQLTNYI